MARMRTVHPDLTESEAVAAWDPWAQIAWTKIWCKMDDKGRIRYNAKYLASVLFPYNDHQTADEIEAHVKEWEAAGSVCRYVVDGKELMHAISWSKYQHPQKPTPSKLPPCPDHDISPPGVSNSYSSATIAVQEASYHGEGGGGGGGGGGGEEDGGGGGASKSPPTPIHSISPNRPNCPKHQGMPYPPPCHDCKEVNARAKTGSNGHTPAPASSVQRFFCDHKIAGLDCEICNKTDEFRKGRF